MTPELTALTLAALWQAVHFCIYSVSANLQVGPKYAMSPRDEPRQITGFAGRAQRAMNNHLEGLILFGIAILTISYTDQTTETTSLIALVYLCARVLYLPAYLFGWAPWRSLIWFVGFAATIALLIAALV